MVEKLARHLASARPVEQDPDGEIMGELLKTVFDARRHEEEIARRKSRSLISMYELAASVHDDVHLVAIVWLLWVVASWRVELHFERAMLEQRHEALAARAGKLRERFGGSEPDATGWGLGRQ